MWNSAKARGVNNEILGEDAYEQVDPSEKPHHLFVQKSGMGLIADDLIYHNGMLFAHVVVEVIQDLPFGICVEVDVDRRLSYGMLERVLDG